MATFEGEVMQAGWRIRVETHETDRPESNEVAEVVERLAGRFIECQTTLQAEGQRIIGQTLENVTTSDFVAEANGHRHTEEAETLTDSKIPDVAP